MREQLRGLDHEETDKSEMTTRKVILMMMLIK